jgi:epoxide hydrolase-like predicted phosphatase
MIRAILFDFGGVLLRQTSGGGMSTWEALLGKSRSELERSIYGTEMGLRALRGEISDDDLWTWAGEHLALSPAQTARLREAFYGSYAIDPAMAELVERLRPLHKTVLISNATDVLRRFVRDVYRADHLFDLIVCSAEERLVKPDPAIYHRTLARLELAPEHAVLVDDRPENVASARAMGMRGIVFGPETSLSGELARLGERHELV